MLDEKSLMLALKTPLGLQRRAMDVHRQPARVPWR
jgi:hypothetical protein